MNPLETFPPRPLPFHVWRQIRYMVRVYSPDAVIGAVRDIQIVNQQILDDRARADGQPGSGGFVGSRDTKGLPHG